MIGGDVEQSTVFERVAENAAQGLRHVAVPPIRHSEPITDIGTDPVFARPQCDQPDHRSRLRLQLDGKGGLVALIHLYKPPDRIADAIGMRHACGLQGNARVAGMANNGFDVPSVRGAELEAFGFKDRANDGLHKKVGLR